MADTNDKDDKDFPFFEERNFTGWLTQFKAVLREFECDELIEEPIPKDVDANGNPIVMNARERQEFERKLKEYKDKDKYAYPRIMKACRRNPKTKNLCETGNFKTAHEILVRLRQRFHVVDETMKASHLLRYSTLKQNEGESGADFVDREQKEYLALRDMGINVDDSLRLTKFIQQDTTNSKHKSLAQTIFTTPNMTLSRATSLFETYHPGDQQPAGVSSVNALFCRYCKKKGHAIQSCTKKAKNEQKNKRKTHTNEKPSTSSQSSHKKKKWRFTCAICDSTEHSSFKCPQREAARTAVLGSKKSSSVSWGADEHSSEEDAT